MVHNYRPRCAAHCRKSSQHPVLLHSPSNLNIRPLSREGMLRRPLYFRTAAGMTGRPAFGNVTDMTQRETPTMPRVAAALFGVALGLAAGGLAFQFIEPERLY